MGAEQGDDRDIKSSAVQHQQTELEQTLKCWTDLALYVTYHSLSGGPLALSLDQWIEYL